MAKKTRNSPIYDLTLLDKGIESTKPLGEFPKKVQIDLKKGHHVAEVSPDYVIVWGNPDWMKKAAYEYRESFFNVVQGDELNLHNLYSTYKNTDDRNLHFIMEGKEDVSEWFRGKVEKKRPKKFTTDEYFISLGYATYEINDIIKEKGGITVKDAKDDILIRSHITKYIRKLRNPGWSGRSPTDASVRNFLKSWGLVWDASKRMYVKM